MVVSRASRLKLRHANHSSRGELASLLDRIAQADRIAFASLHARLRPRLAAQLAMVPLVPTDVTAVADATFVEVWRLAGRLNAQETDALAWIRAIAARRAGDRWVARMALPMTEGQQLNLLATFDRQIETELCALLAHSPSTGDER
ncbi:hypothetical protein ACFPIJ_04580 [Dactylosporangium cerinum]|uniref:RNA polymerase sigma-70 region 2 domain-containing protein n=1 Tax=Dactylosporangium cerinum TaxID=1434730 RepID=A0ABV9VN59_9ACTN